MAMTRLNSFAGSSLLGMIKGFKIVSTQPPVNFTLSLFCGGLRGTDLQKSFTATPFLTSFDLEICKVRIK